MTKYTCLKLSKVLHTLFYKHLTLPISGERELVPGELFPFTFDVSHLLWSGLLLELLGYGSNVKLFND